MPNLKLSLDKRKQKQDKTYPLVFRISVNGQCRDIPLGYSILVNQWNLRTETLKKSAPAYDALTTRIQELQVLYLSKIVEYEKAHPLQVTVGKIVYSGKLTHENSSINISELSKGIYFFKAGKECKIVFKIIKD